MQTITLKAHTDRDGMLKLEIPTNILDSEVEIVLVLQPLPGQFDDMGYPVSYFEESYGSFSDEPLERNQPSEPDIRDDIE